MLIVCSADHVALSAAPTAHGEYCSGGATTSPSSGVQRLLQLRPAGGAAELLLRVEVYDLHAAVASRLLPGDSAFIIIIVTAPASAAV